MFGWLGYYVPIKIAKDDIVATYPSSCLNQLILPSFDTFWLVKHQSWWIFNHLLNMIDPSNCFTHKTHWISKPMGNPIKQPNNTI
jgi:hypothetical protein